MDSEKRIFESFCKIRGYSKEYIEMFEEKIKETSRYKEYRAIRRLNSIRNKEMFEMMTIKT